MQQRRPRLGDILDDYCPRERRITNHAVVAMIEDEVKQTRCSTCDAEHEYKQAKVPVSRRKKIEHPAAGDLVAASASQVPMSDSSSDEPLDDLAEPLTDDALEIAAQPPDISDTSVESFEDEGPVHRRLIRATLPRPEGQAPERKEPDFTMRNPTGRFDQHNGQRRGRQPAHQNGQPFGPSARQGGQRQGAGAGRQGGQEAGGHRQRNGNRTGNAAGERAGRPFGANRSSRPGGGQGRKRGR